MRGGQVFLGALDGVSGAAVNDDLGALAKEKRGGRLSDAFGGPGNECELAFEVVVHDGLS